MIKTIKKFLHRFIPKEMLASSEEVIAHAENFLFVSFLTSIILFIFVTIFYFSHQYYLVYINICSIIVITPAWLLFKQLRSFAIAGNLLMFGAFLSLCFGSAVEGGIDAPGIIWFGAAQLGGLFILKGRAGYYWSFAFSFAAALFVLVPMITGYHFPNVMDADAIPVIKLASVIGSGVSIVLLAKVYHDERNLHLKQIEQKRHDAEDALKNLREADRLLFDKLSENASLARVLSHDVSNPLMVISYMIKVLEKKDNGSNADTIIRMKKALQNATEIITQVRMLQALNSGKLQLELTPVSLLEILEETQNTFKEKLEEKNLKMKVVFENPAIVPMVLAEKNSLANSVVNNLVSNAIKFSKPGGIIEVQIIDRGSTCLFRVKDQGIGIPQELLKNLFRADQATSRMGTAGEKGTGFGMPLVKSYLNYFGAEIHVTSRTADQDPENHGTQFDIEFKKAS